MRKIRLKASMALCIAAAMCFSGVSGNTAVLAQNDDWSKGEVKHILTDVDSINDDVKHVIALDDKNIVFPIKKERLVLPEAQKSSSRMKTKAISIPEAYDPRLTQSVTSIKDQGEDGTCWSFAAISTAESNLIKKGIGTSDIDLSELHLAYYFYNAGVDPIGGLRGDYNEITESSGDYLNTGGLAMFTQFFMASWSGPVLEKDFIGYKNATSVLDTAELRTNGYGQYANTYANLRDSVWTSMTDTDVVKKLIYNNGAVAVDMFADSAFEETDGSGSYYNSLFESTNHEISIVGWDDTYSRNNFKNRSMNVSYDDGTTATLNRKAPTKDGAWLVKNSWGTESGDKGYWWVSYEDKGLNSEGNTAMSLDFDEAGSKYTNNYQYDGTCSDYCYQYTDTDTARMANVFTPKADEFIKAVGFYTYGNIGGKAEISVFTDITDPLIPTSGTLASSKELAIERDGYSTVDLINPVGVAAGQPYAVVIRIKQDRAKSINFLIDMTHMDESLWVNYVASTQAGQSFIADDSSKWYDVSDPSNQLLNEDKSTKYSANVRIKSFTVNANQDASVKSIKLNKKKIALRVGKTYKLRVTFNPEIGLTSAKKKIKWTSSKKKVATVTSVGKVKAKKKGTTKITAKSYNNKKARCTVVVKRR